MTLPPRFPLCPLCHGLHAGIPDCAGRPQTDEEWMVDRGVPRARALEIVASRARLAAAGHALPAMARLPDDPRRLF